MSTGLVLLLVIGIPLVVLALIIGGSIGAVNAFRGTPVTDSVDADAASMLLVNATNASIHLSASDDDDEIHATMNGSYAGRKPSLDVTTAGGQTEIRGGCPGGWFLINRCQVRIEVSVPSDLDVTVGGQNGAIRADGLTGDLDLSTTNGSVEVDESSGVLSLHSTNGKIELQDSASTDVVAETTNGAVLLSFSDAPDEVTANSTNGGIRIVVPDDGTEYFIEAETTNGGVDTEDVPGDRRADRTITAGTTNGGITIETSHRR
ncbi:Putative adhesin [Mycetocola miduiensis]|uniref:Putative adhesin n=2 Tax=Mycetocola miduiensis TaxID=995034 RepID=A0A1I5C386_9MICO|nr:Putative adhesin [Mycetocola miduiensis]